MSLAQMASLARTMTGSQSAADGVHVMLDQQHGDAVGHQRAQVLADLAREYRVHSSHRFRQAAAGAAPPSKRGDLQQLLLSPHRSAAR